MFILSGKFLANEPRSGLRIRLSQVVFAAGSGALVAVSSAAAADLVPLVVARAERVAGDDLRQVSSLPDARIDLRILSQDLSATLQLIGEQAGVRVVMDKALGGKIMDVSLKGSLRDALDQIAERGGAVWWWDGTAVRLADRRNAVERSIQMNSPEILFQAAKDLGYPTHVLDYAFDRTSGLVRVSGPAEIVREMEDLATRLRQRLSRVPVTRYGSTAVVSVGSER